MSLDTLLYMIVLFILCTPNCNISWCCSISLQVISKSIKAWPDPIKAGQLFYDHPTHAGPNLSRSQTSPSTQVAHRAGKTH